MRRAATSPRRPAAPQTRPEPRTVHGGQPCTTTAAAPPPSTTSIPTIAPGAGSPPRPSSISTWSNGPAMMPSSASSAHGPFEGGQAASGYAPALVLPGAEDADDGIIATCPAALHPTDQPAIPGTAWQAVPEEIAASAHPAPGQTGAAVLVLLDRTHAVFATVGPFDNHADADAWRPTPHIERTVDRLVIGMRPPPEPDATA